MKYAEILMTATAAYFKPCFKGPLSLWDSADLPCYLLL